MARRRPAVLTVMGILNIVFGSLGLLCNLCAGLSLLLSLGGAMQAGQGQGGGNPFGEDPEMVAFLRAEVPGYAAVRVIQVVVGLATCVVLILAGIGLLKMQRWGRMLSIAYSIVGILVTLGSLVYTLALVNPAMGRFLAGRVAVNNLNSTQLLAIINVVTVAVAILSMAYDVILLIMVLLPSVSAAFAGRPQDYDLDRQDDEDDDLGRERRWREEGHE
jgi:hypothetical protein